MSMTNIYSRGPSGNIDKLEMILPIHIDKVEDALIEARRSSVYSYRFVRIPDPVNDNTPALFLIVTGKRKLSTMPAVRPQAKE